MAQIQVRQITSYRTLNYLLLFGVAISLAIVGLYTDLIIPIAAVFGVVALVVIIKRPFWGFILYLAFIYLRPADVIAPLAAIRAQALLLVLLLILWIYRDFIRDRKPFVLQRIDYALLAFLGAIYLSMFTTYYVAASMTVLIDFTEFVVFYFLAAHMLEDEKDLKTLIIVMIACLAFVCFVQIWTYFTIGLTRVTGLGGYGIHIGPLNLSAGKDPAGDSLNVNGVGGYSGGFLANASELGLGILVMFPFVYYLYSARLSRLLKFILLGTLGTYLASLIFTGSRGAVVGLAAVFLVIFLKSRKKLILAFVALLALGITVPLLPDRYIDRVASTTDAEDESANIRLTLWTAGLHMVADRPLFGVGVNNFPNAYGAKYRPAGSPDLYWAPHNDFVQAATELGLVGLFAFIWIFVVIFKENRRNRHFLKHLGVRDKFLDAVTQSIDVAMVGFAVAGSFITSTYYPHLYMLALMGRTVSKIIADKYTAADLVDEPERQALEAPAQV